MGDVRLADKHEASPGVERDERGLAQQQAPGHAPLGGPHVLHVLLQQVQRHTLREKSREWRSGGGHGLVSEGGTEGSMENID